MDGVLVVQWHALSSRGGGSAGSETHPPPKNLDPKFGEGKIQFCFPFVGPPPLTYVLILHKQSLNGMPHCMPALTTRPHGGSPRGEGCECAAVPCMLTPPPPIPLAQALKIKKTTVRRAPVRDKPVLARDVQHQKNVCCQKPAPTPPLIHYLSGTRMARYQVSWLSPQVYPHLGQSPK